MAHEGRKAFSRRHVRRNPANEARLGPPGGAPEQPAAAASEPGEAYGGVGAQLKQERIRRGFELADVATRLRIRLANLNALEEGRFDELPGKIYALGFLRTYAEFLGVDGAAVVRLFKEESDGGIEPAKLNFPVPEPESRLPGLGLLALAALIAGATYGGWYMWQEQSQDRVAAVPEVPDRLVAQAGLAPTQDAPVQDGSVAVATAQASPVETSLPVATLPAVAPPVAPAATPPVARQSIALAPQTTETPPQLAASPTPAADLDPDPDPVPDTVDVTKTARSVAIPAPPPESPIVTAVPTQSAVDATAGRSPAGAMVPEFAGATESAAGANASPAATDRQRLDVAAVTQGGAGRAAPAPALPSAAGTATDGAVMVEAPEPSGPTAAEPLSVASLLQGDVAEPARQTDEPALNPTDGVPRDQPRVYGTAGADSRVVVRARMDSWVQVRGAGNELLLTRILRPGDQYYAPDIDDVVMVTGNAGGLEITVDGRTMPPIGSVGEVARNVSLNADRLLSELSR